MSIVKEIHEVKKTNSSYGNWAVICDVTFPWATLPHALFFFSKKDAENVKVGSRLTTAGELDKNQELNN